MNTNFILNPNSESGFVVNFEFRFELYRGYLDTWFICNDLSNKSPNNYYSDSFIAEHIIPLLIEMKSKLLSVVISTQSVK